MSTEPSVDPGLRRAMNLAHVKRSHDRFDDSFEHSAFAAHDFSQVLRDIRAADADEAFAAEISRRGSNRWCEVLDEGLADQRADERYEERYGSAS